MIWGWAGACLNTTPIQSTKAIAISTYFPVTVGRKSGALSLMARLSSTDRLGPSRGYNQFYSPELSPQILGPSLTVVSRMVRMSPLCLADAVSIVRAMEACTYQVYIDGQLFILPQMLTLPNYLPGLAVQSLQPILGRRALLQQPPQYYNRKVSLWCLQAPLPCALRRCS